MGEGVLGIHENDRHNHRDTYTGIHPHSFIHYTTLSFFPFSHNHALFFHAITQIRKGFSRHRAHKNNLSQITHGGRLRKHVIIFFIFAQSRNNKAITQSRIPMGGGPQTCSHKMLSERASQTYPHITHQRHGVSRYCNKQARPAGNHGDKPMVRPESSRRNRTNPNDVELVTGME